MNIFYKKKISKLIGIKGSFLMLDLFSSLKSRNRLTAKKKLTKMIGSLRIT